MPSRKCLCTKKNNMMIGSVAIVVAAQISFHGMGLPLLPNAARATCTTLIVSLFVTIKGHKKLFQDSRKEYSPTVRRAGLDRG